MTANSSQRITIDVPHQGVHHEFKTTKEAANWFQTEADFLHSVQQHLSGQFQVGSDTFNPRRDFNLATTAQGVLDTLQSKDHAALEGLLDKYHAEAAEFNTFLSEGYPGEWLNECLKDHNENAVKLLVATFSANYSKGFERTPTGGVLNIVRELLFRHPVFKSHFDISAAKKGREQSSELISEINDVRYNLEENIIDWENRIQELERRYREEITLKEPARYWEEKANDHRETAIWAFAGFALVIGISIWTAWEHHNELIEILKSAGSDNSAGFIRGLAILTVPTLAIAWVLRHISRIFVQNFVQRHDALNRKMLAYTYLSLAENKDLSIGEKERALILNALFRPGPPHSGDEGPPTGLMDLMKNKND